MPGDALFHVTVTFAIVTGTAAGILALLSWEVFRHSAFGRVIFAFAAVMSVFILYHVVLMAAAEPLGSVAVLESVFYTGLALFVGLMIRVELRLSDTSTREVIRTWR